MLESLFNKVAGLKFCNLINKRLQQMLSCEYCEILKNSIFTKYLRWLLLYLSRKKVFKYLASKNANQKLPFRGDAMKMCSENMQQIYRRRPLPKYNFNVAKQLY